MPALATKLRRIGLKVNNAVEGELVTFRGAPLRCVIQWPNAWAEVQPEIGEVRADDRTTTIIEIMFIRLTEAPRADETIMDENGNYHRIAKVRQTDSTWFCDCEFEEAS